MSSTEKGTQASYLPAPAPEGAGTITFEDIGRFPRRAEVGCGGRPGAVCFAPDDTADLLALVAEAQRHGLLDERVATAGVLAPLRSLVFALREKRAS